MIDWVREPAAHAVAVGEVVGCQAEQFAGRPGKALLGRPRSQATASIGRSGEGTYYVVRQVWTLLPSASAASARAIRASMSAAAARRSRADARRRRPLRRGWPGRARARHGGWLPVWRASRRRPRMPRRRRRGLWTGRWVRAHKELVVGGVDGAGEGGGLHGRNIRVSCLPVRAAWSGDDRRRSQRSVSHGDRTERFIAPILLICPTTEVGDVGALLLGLPGFRGKGSRRKKQPGACAVLGQPAGPWRRGRGGPGGAYGPWWMDPASRTSRMTSCKNIAGANDGRHRGLTQRHPYPSDASVNLESRAQRPFAVPMDGIFHSLMPRLDALARRAPFRQEPHRGKPS